MVVAFIGRKRSWVDSGRHGLSAWGVCTALCWSQVASSVVHGHLRHYGSIIVGLGGCPNETSELARPRPCAPDTWASSDGHEYMHVLRIERQSTIRTV
ncbi:hypothetical protein NL676_035641 [Syzygium grande]|nr:hypothetical protein NL676_035641 [Syzygium grande]